MATIKPITAAISVAGDEMTDVSFYTIKFWKLIAGLFVILGLVWVEPAFAQSGNINQFNAVCNPLFPTRCIQPDSSGAVPVTGTFSATLGGFAPGGTYATLAVSTSSSRVALPAGVVVVVQNVGATTAYVNLGDGTVTATTSQIQVPASSWIALTVGANVDLAAITSSSTTTLTLIGGAGLATGAGGGAAGGGGGGAVTIASGAVASGAYSSGSITSGAFASGSVGSGAIASGAIASGAVASGAVASGAFAAGSISDGADVTLGAKADAKSTATDTTAVSIMSVLKEISAMVQVPAALPANQSMNIAQINGVTPLMGAGNTGTGALRVSLADNSAGVIALGAAGSPPGGTSVVTVQGAASMTALAVSAASGTFASGSIAAGAVAAGATSFVKLEDVAAVSADAGVPSMAIQTVTAADTATDGDYSMLQMKNGALFVQTIPNTANGATLYTLTAANSTNATNVKASAGNVYGLSGYTISATPAWLSLYNTAGTPTCGTGIIQQYLIPGSTAGAGFNIAFDAGKTFATGIGICLTTGIAGTGSVAATSYVVNVDYK